MSTGLIPTSAHERILSPCNYLLRGGKTHLVFLSIHVSSVVMTANHTRPVDGLCQCDREGGQYTGKDRYIMMQQLYKNAWTALKAELTFIKIILETQHYPFMIKMDCWWPSAPMKVLSPRRLLFAMTRSKCSIRPWMKWHTKRLSSGPWQSYRPSRKSSMGNKTKCIKVSKNGHSSITNKG